MWLWTSFFLVAHAHDVADGRDDDEAAGDEPLHPSLLHRVNHLQLLELFRGSDGADEDIRHLSELRRRFRGSLCRSQRGG